MKAGRWILRGSSELRNLSLQALAEIGLHDGKFANVQRCILNAFLEYELRAKEKRL